MNPLSENLSVSLASSNEPSATQLRFWIPEITTYVVEVLLDGEGLQGSLSSVLALARTCQSTLGPAMRILWSKQVGFDNLIQTLPSDAWARIKDVSCTRETLVSSIIKLRVLSKYSNCIRVSSNRFSLGLDEVIVNL